MKYSEAQDIAIALSLNLRDVLYLQLGPGGITARIVDRDPEGHIHSDGQGGVMAHDKRFAYEQEGE